METYIIKTPKEFIEFCKRLKPIYSIDTETTSLKWLDLEIIGFSICDGQQACYVNITSKYKKGLLQILDYYISEAKMIVMHNSHYDLMALKKEGIEV